MKGADDGGVKEGEDTNVTVEGIHLHFLQPKFFSAFSASIPSKAAANLILSLAKR